MLLFKNPSPTSDLKSTLLHLLRTALRLTYYTVAPGTVATNDRVEKRRLDEEYPALITNNRHKKCRAYEEDAEASCGSSGQATQSISRGQGIQQTGGNFSVGGNLSFGNN